MKTTIIKINKFIFYRDDVRNYIKTKPYDPYDNFICYSTQRLMGKPHLELRSIKDTDTFTFGTIQLHDNIIGKLVLCKSANHSTRSIR